MEATRIPLAATIALGRIGEPADSESAVAFLVSGCRKLDHRRNHDHRRRSTARRNALGFRAATRALTAPV